MAKQVLVLFILVLLPMQWGPTVKLVTGQGPQGTWCVAKPSTTEEALQANIAYACGFVDCSVIRYPDGACYYPATSINHASVVMNLYYKREGPSAMNCNFAGTGLQTVTYPGYGICDYA